MELPAPSDPVNAICAKFRIDWNKRLNPQIADHLNGQDEPVRSQMLRALIAEEIELRASDGEFPAPDDYVEMGPEAVNFAKQILAESKPSIPADFEQPTAFFSVDALGDKSETFEFDEVSGDENTLFRDSTGETSSTEQKYIGRYKLLQQIGVGGMGAVWMAEQLEPVKRRVALKVIRADVGSESAVARFEAERQACAMMDHQNIAKILDAGTTETGYPYFVMELVNGVPLNQYCDKRKLGIRERLQLMIPVCRAVQHAHQKGIIHRDLKHSNVLVTEYDGEPVPKVIDFGLAKALGHQDTLTDKTMFTEIGKVVGTLQYMSPEQAETNNMDVDTRSDVYSLGVMIYKLLVGATPIENDTVVQVSLLETLRLIREQEASRPSLRVVSNDETVKKLCELRKVQPERLKQILQGDLDWIVMKALEKDRRDRYETANGLAMELERYLNDEQVLARPPSAIYSLKKFVRRNRGLVASILALSFMLVSGILATSAATVWALKERKIAVNKGEIADNERNRANEKSALAEAAKREAVASEKMRKVELLAARLTSAWSDWQLGNTEPAWLTLNKLSDDENGWESRYLRSEFSSSQQILYGHSRDVVTLDVSDDGIYIATGALDDSLKVWSAETKELVYTRLVQDLPTCVRFSPGSKLVACADRTNRISIWDVASGEPRQTLGPIPTDITCIEFMPDGNELIVGAAESDSFRVEDGRERIRDENASPPPVRIVSAKDGKVIQELKGHSKDVISISCGPQGSMIASCGLDSRVLVWRKTDDGYKLHYELDNHVQGVTCVSISPSGKHLLSSSRDHTIRLWNLETGELIRTLVGHTDAVNSARFSSDGKLIVSASTDRTARIWNLNGDEILTCKEHFDSLNDARFSTNSREILTASDDKTVRIWNAKDKPSTVIVHAHTDTVWAAEFLNDGKIVASASEDGTVALINTFTGEVIGQTIKHPAATAEDAVDSKAILSLAVSPGSKMLATGGADGRVLIWNALNSKLIRQLEAHDHWVWDVAFSPDGKKMVTASADSTVKVWNTRDWSLAHELTDHTGEVASARFSHDGKLLATASDDETVKLWDGQSFELLKSFVGHTNTVWKAVFSPDKKLIASSGYNGEIIIWDVAERELLHRIPAHTNQVAGLAFSKDGTRLVSSSDDQTIKIWDVESKIELFLLRDHGDTQIAHVSFSDDGRKLVSGNRDGWVTIRAVSDSDANIRLFLPQDVDAMAIDGIDVIVRRDATVEDLQIELGRAEKCCNHYPTYQSYRNRGIAQYRLGMNEEAIESLTEAERLEPIHYGQSDEPPYIEGFLAMVLFKSGDFKKAEKFRREFETIREDTWMSEDKITNVSEEIREVFASGE